MHPENCVFVIVFYVFVVRKDTVKTPSQRTLLHSLKHRDVRKVVHILDVKHIFLNLFQVLCKGSFY